MRAALAEIDLSAVRENLRRVRARAPAAQVLAIVKADGYGHGLEAVAQALSEGEGRADAFGVASIDDAQRLRSCGIAAQIVLLSGFDELADFSWIRELQLDCVVHHAHQLALLAQLDAADFVVPVRIWVKLDTGMRRLGFDPNELPKVLAQLRSYDWVEPNIVVMSHFAQADEIGVAQHPHALLAKSRTLAQIEAFDTALARHSRGAPFAQSLANSGALLSVAESHRQWQRPGGILYGLSTHDQLTGAELGFQPAMRLSTKLVSTKHIKAGDRVGYGGSFTAAADMRIGIAAVGYGDGYPRHAPTGTPVLVAGEKTRTLGRVAMDLLTVDLSDMPHVEVGAEVLLWGPELPVETIARCAETISYELTCGVTKRVRFRYLAGV
jgi:alanine racemase